MVTIKFIGATMTSKGIYYVNDGIYEVPEEVADYLERTFKSIERLQVAKEVPEVKPKVEVKVGAKVVPNK